MTRHETHKIKGTTSEAIPKPSNPPRNHKRNEENKIGLNRRAINQKPLRAETKNGFLPITPRRPIANIHNATMTQVKLIMPKFLISITYPCASTFEYVPYY